MNRPSISLTLGENTDIKNGIAVFSEYAEFHGITEQKEEKKSENVFKLLVKAPSSFWTVGLVQFFCWAAFMYMWTYTNGAIADNIWGVTDAKAPEYQEAGNWVGVLFAVQAIGSVLWAIVIPFFKSHKIIYSTSLVLGGIGFLSTFFVHDQYVMFVSFVLIGCAWAAMLAMPFTILTNSLKGGNMGTYLGLFNGTICIPQIVAAALGGSILKLLGGSQVLMLVLAGILLIVGAAVVVFIKEGVKED